MAKPSPVRLLPLVLMLGIATVLGTALYSKEPARQSPLVGTMLPEIDLPNLIESRPRLTGETLKGRYVLINVFASWCGVCVMEHPFISGVEAAYGIPVYGIAWRDDPDDTRAWLRKHGNPYRTVGVDQEGDFVIRLGVTGTPESFLIGPDGTILQHYPGALDQAAFEAEFLPHIVRR